MLKKVFKGILCSVFIILIVSAGGVVFFAIKSTARPSKESLFRKVSNSTRIIVRNARHGGYENYKREGDVLFELTMPSEVKEFIAGIDVDEKRSRGFCACSGQPAIEFYEGDQFITAVGMHHGTRLRWKDWPAANDGELTQKSVEYFQRVFLLRGYDLTDPFAFEEKH